MFSRYRCYYYIYIYTLVEVYSSVEVYSGSVVCILYIYYIHV